MLLKPEVEVQLHQIFYQRNKNLWIFHTSLMAASSWFQREKIFSTPYGTYALIVTALALVLRLLLFRVFYKQWKEKQVWARSFNLFGQVVLACGWALHFWSIFSVYGPNAYNTSNTVIIMAGIITGASISSVAHRATYHALTCTMSLLIMGTYLCTPSADNSIAIFTFIFYLFNTYHLNIGHKQLCRSINNEINSLHEKERIVRIIDAVPGYVAVFDENLVCTMANSSTLAMSPDLIGRKVGSSQDESDWEAFLKNFVNSGKTEIMMEAHYKKSGRNFWMLRSAHRTFEGGVVVASIDITELVEARNRLREQEATAQYTAKLASLGEMAAGIAHEINNPLAIIQGAASVINRMVDQEPMDVDTIKVLTNKLSQTIERITKTIKSLKSLSRSGENDPFEELDLEKLLDQSLELLRNRLERHEIELKLPSFPTPVTFRGREVQLSQVLMNLISNAIDAVKNRPNAWIEISYLYGIESLDIFVTDSGPGIADEIRTKIMEPFFTTKEVNQGTGLGLSISKSIMSAHGGELTLMEGTHTTFRMHLPLKLPLS